MLKQQALETNVPSGKPEGEAASENGETQFAKGETRRGALTLQQTEALLLASLKRENRACATAVGLMLWAGVRPCELARIRWMDFCFADDCIIISKAGTWTECARLAPIYPILTEWLQFAKPICLRSAPVIPRSWGRRWRRLRSAAGFGDRNRNRHGLRYTFAAYHDRYFRDELRLLRDMDANADILQSLQDPAFDGVTRETAAIYWEKMVQRVAAKAAAQAAEAEA